MSFETSKKAAAQAAVAMIEENMVVGLGTGSTAIEMVHLLAQRVAEGLNITAVATSEAIANQARQAGIKLLEGYPDFKQIDLTLDGADEADPKGRLLKGGGGALLREKLVATASTRLIIMVDESKCVTQLGKNWSVPVEVIPFGQSAVKTRLEYLGAQVQPRLQAGNLFKTDQGNLIYDCNFGPIADPETLHAHIKALTGVVETGLFLSLTNTLIIGDETGKVRIRHFYPTPPNYTSALV